MGNLFKLGLAAYGIFALLQNIGTSAATAFYEGLKIRFERVQPHLDLNSMTFRLEIFYEIENTNNVGVSVTSFDGLVSYADAALGTVFLPAPFSLPAGSLRELHLSFATPIAALPSVLGNLLTGGWQGLRLNLIGNLDTDVVSIPIDEEIILV